MALGDALRVQLDARSSAERVARDRVSAGAIALTSANSFDGQRIPHRPSA